MKYSQASMVRTSLGPWKFVPDMVVEALSYELIITPGQEANRDNLGMSFSIFSKIMVC